MNRHGHWVCWMSMDKKNGLVWTTCYSAQNAVYGLAASACRLEEAGRFVGTCFFFLGGENIIPRTMDGFVPIHVRISWMSVLPCVHACMQQGSVIMYDRYLWYNVPGINIIHALTSALAPGMVYVPLALRVFTKHLISTGKYVDRGFKKNTHLQESRFNQFPTHIIISLIPSDLSSYRECGAKRLEMRGANQYYSTTTGIRMETSTWYHHTPLGWIFEPIFSQTRRAGTTKTVASERSCRDLCTDASLGACTLLPVVEEII